MKDYRGSIYIIFIVPFPPARSPSLPLCLPSFSFFPSPLFFFLPLLKLKAPFITVPSVISYQLVYVYEVPSLTSPAPLCKAKDSRKTKISSPPIFIFLLHHRRSTFAFNKLCVYEMNSLDTFLLHRHSNKSSRPGEVHSHLQIRHPRPRCSKCHV